MPGGLLPPARREGHYRGSHVGATLMHPLLLEPWGHEAGAPGHAALASAQGEGLSAWRAARFDARLRLCGSWSHSAPQPRRRASPALQRGRTRARTGAARGSCQTGGRCWRRLRASGRAWMPRCRAPMHGSATPPCTSRCARWSIEGPGVRTAATRLAGLAAPVIACSHSCAAHPLAFSIAARRRPDAFSTPRWHIANIVCLMLFQRHFYSSDKFTHGANTCRSLDS